MSDRSNLVDKPDGDNEIRTILIECQRDPYLGLVFKAPHTAGFNNK